MANPDYLYDEFEIDAEVKAALDAHLLGWPGTSGEPMLGGAGYAVHGKPFAALLEGVVAMHLPSQLRARAFTLAGVSPLPAAQDAPRFAGWAQFLLLLPEDLDAVLPWLRAAYDYTAQENEG